MTIQIGDHLPDGVLSEYLETADGSCAVGPNFFNVNELTKSKRIVVFGLPGAFTPTCSAQHVPGYVAHAAEFKAKGIDEVWCISVNDAHVMRAWGRDQNAAGTVRMMADGSAAFTKALGLEVDLGKAGMGIRSRRYSMLVEDGVVTQLNLEASSKFEVSKAEYLLAQLG